MKMLKKGFLAVLPGEVAAFQHLEGGGRGCWLQVHQAEVQGTREDSHETGNGL